MVILDLRIELHHQGAAVVRHKNSHVVGLADIVPSNQIVGHNPVDEQRKLALLVPLTPPLLPGFDHRLDGFFVLVQVGAIGFGHRGAQEGCGGELLRLVDAARHLHLNSPGSLDRHSLKLAPTVSRSASAFFDVGEDE